MTTTSAKLSAFCLPGYPIAVGPFTHLAEERDRLHPVPAVPFTAALGVTRKVDALSLVTFEGGQYSVPHELAGQPVTEVMHSLTAFTVYVVTTPLTVWDMRLPLAS